MKWSWFGRSAMALVSALALGLSMTACGGGTIAYIWTIGQQYSEVYGFKVDNNTGNLTAIPGSPIAAGGKNPVSIAVKSGGRYVYVLNQGGTVSQTSNSSDANVSVFSVGGEGTLTLQQTYNNVQGFDHTWMAFDSSGSYLFVLDKYSASGDGNGAVTTYSVDANTGRLTLVTQSASTPSGGNAPTYLEVGQNPIMLTATAGCLFALNTADQTVTPFAYSSGQLTVPTTGKIPLHTANATSINGNAGTMVVTDAQIATPGGTPPPGYIFPFTITTGCTLTSYTGGAVQNGSNVSDPVYSLLDAKGTTLFVLNKSTTLTGTTHPYSQITGFTISNQQLAPPTTYVSGPGPTCMVEDPSQRFMYESNYNDGSITGYSYNNVDGSLSALARGSTFSTGNAQGVCLVISGAVD